LAPAHFDVVHRSVSLLDFFVVSRPDLVNFSDQFWIPHISKHAFIYISVDCPLIKSNESYSYRDYYRVDTHALLNEASSTDLSIIFNSTDIDFKIELLNKFILYLLNKYLEQEKIGTELLNCTKEMHLMKTY